jgi:hypothetical protein
VCFHVGLMGDTQYSKATLLRMIRNKRERSVAGLLGQPKKRTNFQNPGGESRTGGRAAPGMYRQTHMQRRTTLRDRRPTSVGGPITALTGDDDLLGEMLA